MHRRIDISHCFRLSYGCLGWTPHSLRLSQEVQDRHQRLFRPQTDMGGRIEGHYVGVCGGATIKVIVRNNIMYNCAVGMCEILVAMGTFTLREARKDFRIRLLPEEVVLCLSTRHCVTCENMTGLVLDFGEPNTYVSPEHEADPSEFCLVHRRRKETLLDVCCAFQRPFDHVLLLLDALSETVNQIRAPIENLWHSLFAPPDIENF